MAKLELGVLTKLDQGAERAIRIVHEFGLPTCQLDTWNVALYTAENAAIVRETVRKTGVRISALWSGYPGPHTWDFLSGPATIGFVPDECREMRVKAMLKAGHFARDIGVKSVITHAGFLPEDAHDPRYKAAVRALRRIATAYRKLGIEFWFETGQETPVTLLRTIEDIGTDNLGINLDPANLILYGKGNPVDALDVFGKWVKGCHAKDGLYPTNGRSLGLETPLGKGRVNFPVLLPKLYKLGYRGPLTIEREISGPQQIRDIRQGAKYLAKIIAAL